MKTEVTDTNLYRLLKAKHIHTSVVAGIIGTTESQAYRKIAKRFPFKLAEALAIYRGLLPEYSFDYVFDGYDQIDGKEE